MSGSYPHSLLAGTEPRRPIQAAEASSRNKSPLTMESLCNSPCHHHRMQHTLSWHSCIGRKVVCVFIVQRKTGENSWKYLRVITAQPALPISCYSTWEHISHIAMACSLSQHASKPPCNCVWEREGFSKLLPTQIKYCIKVAFNLHIRGNLEKLLSVIKQRGTERGRSTCPSL